MAVTSTAKGSRKDKMPEKKPVKSAVGSTIDNAISMLKSQEKAAVQEQEYIERVEEDVETPAYEAHNQPMLFAKKKEKKIMKKKISGYVPVELADDFYKECERQNISISYCMEELIKMFLGRGQ